MEMAPHYFDLDKFPEYEVKVELEVAYWRLVHSRISKR